MIIIVQFASRDFLFSFYCIFHLFLESLLLTPSISSLYLSPLCLSVSLSIYLSLSLLSPSSSFSFTSPLCARQMGPNGNVDTIVPHKTRTYAEGGQAADTDGVPMCTLRNFPQVPPLPAECWGRVGTRKFFQLLELVNISRVLKPPRTNNQTIF